MFLAIQESSIDAYLKMIRKVSLLTPEQELALAHRSKAGCKASYNTLVERNLRLVIKPARSKAQQHQSTSFADLIQAGNEGLMHAATKYDPDMVNEENGKSFRFTTYASWWIKQSIHRAVQGESKTIRIPVHVWQQNYTYWSTERELIAEGKPHTDKDIIEACQLKWPHKASQFTVDQKRKIAKAMMLEQSISDFATEEDDESEMDIVARINPRACADFGEEEVAKNHVGRYVEHLLHILNDREAKVIRLRYGIGVKVEYTLDQVGDVLGCTRERVRQIQVSAENKLKNHVTTRTKMRHADFF